MVSIAAGRRPDVSTVHAGTLTSHGSVFDRGLVRRIASGWGRTITVLDESVRRSLIETFRFPASRVVVVPNGVDERRFFPASEEVRERARGVLGLGPQDRVMSFVGAMVAVKRPGWCVRALEAACREIPSARLVLAGDGPLKEECVRLAGSLAVGDRCVWTGWLADPRPVLHASDVLLLPSASEGFALVCVEAMLCGVPCVRTRGGGCAAQIIDGKTGWSVGAESEDEFVRAAVRALGGGADTRAVGSAARDHALAELTESKFLERMHRVYGDAIALHGSSISA